MKLLLIDGNSILNRAFYGIKTLTTKDGRYTNAIYGFLNILLRQMEEQRPDLVGVTFDLPGGTFRNRLYAGYKANRKGMPEELAQQLPVVRQLLEDMGLTVITCPDYEADDILGTLSRVASEQKVECLILSGDRDSLQLIDNWTNVLYPSVRNGRTETLRMDAQAVVEKFGVSPTAFIDMKALMGDSSDNVPGVSGCGEKTASTLIATFGDLDGVYANLDSPTIKPAMRQHLMDDREMAYLSKELVTIDRHAPVEENLDHYRPGARQDEKVYQTLADLEMHSMIEKMKLAPSFGSPAPTPTRQPAKEIPAAKQVPVEQWNPQGPICVLWLEEGWVALAEEEMTQLSDEQLLNLLQRELPIYTQDSKRLYHLALSGGIRELPIEMDVALAGYLLNPASNDYSVDKLAVEYHVQPTVATEPAALGVLRPLCETLLEQLRRQDMESLLRDIEMPLAKVLAAMEREGFLVDTDGIRAFGEELTQLSEASMAFIYDQVGHTFNLNSPKQLGTVLFEEMNLPYGRKTKTGYSTDRETLESLRAISPVVQQILDYRTYAKLNATYVEGLLQAAGETGRVHSEFRQTETRTGRISSVNPNLQNIPIRTELGSRMRRFFVAKEGYTLLDADYSQIELRVLASMSNDEHMITAFKEGHDIHTETACKVFRLDREQITDELRRRAKAVNFGIVYGIGAYSLSQDIGVSVKEAQEYIDSYMASFPNVSAYLKQTVENATRDGFVTTLYHRRRAIPELKNSNKQVQALGKRLAMNTPVQGTAADIIKIAMIRVYNRLAAECPEAKLILQVHDELIVEVPDALVDKASHILHEEMIHAADLKTGLVAEVHGGKNWYDAH